MNLKKYILIAASISLFVGNAAFSMIKREANQQFTDKKEYITKKLDHLGKTKQTKIKMQRREREKQTKKLTNLLKTSTKKLSKIKSSKELMFEFEEANKMALDLKTKYFTDSKKLLKDFITVLLPLLEVQIKKEVKNELQKKLEIEIGAEYSKEQTIEELEKKAKEQNLLLTEDIENIEEEKVKQQFVPIFAREVTPLIEQLTKKITEAKLGKARMSLKARNQQKEDAINNLVIIKIQLKDHQPSIGEIKENLQDAYYLTMDLMTKYNYDAQFEFIEIVNLAKKLTTSTTKIKSPIKAKKKKKAAREKKKQITMEYFTEKEKTETKEMKELFSQGKKLLETRTKELENLKKAKEIKDLNKIFIIIYSDKLESILKNLQTQTSEHFNELIAKIEKLDDPITNEITRIEKLSIETTNIIFDDTEETIETIYSAASLIDNKIAENIKQSDSTIKYLYENNKSELEKITIENYIQKTVTNAKDIIKALDEAFDKWNTEKKIQLEKIEKEESKPKKKIEMKLSGEEEEKEKKDVGEELSEEDFPVESSEEEEEEEEKHKIFIKRTFSPTAITIFEQATKFLTKIKDKTKEFKNVTTIGELVLKNIPEISKKEKEILEKLSTLHAKGFIAKGKSALGFKTEESKKAHELKLKVTIAHNEFAKNYRLIEEYFKQIIKVNGFIKKLKKTKLTKGIDETKKNILSSDNTFTKKVNSLSKEFDKIINDTKSSTVLPAIATKLKTELPKALKTFQDRAKKHIKQLEEQAKVEEEKKKLKKATRKHMIDQIKEIILISNTNKRNQKIYSEINLIIGPEKLKITSYINLRKNLFSEYKTKVSQYYELEKLILTIEKTKYSSTRLFKTAADKALKLNNELSDTETYNFPDQEAEIAEAFNNSPTNKPFKKNYITK